MPEDVRTRLQRRAQNAVLAIVNTGEPLAVTIAELVRLSKFIDSCIEDADEAMYRSAIGTWPSVQDGESADESNDDEVAGWL